MVEFRDTPEEAAFRTEVRAFVAANRPADETVLRRTSLGSFIPETPEQEQFFNGWQKAVAQRGWIAPHWPKEYGGAGMSTVEQFIFNEELANARMPAVGGMGITHIGPVLILYGSEEQ